ncbi:hypothetical protein BDN70DRAFT_879945 [Pholiota conissans]|uniref:Nascent polypeptide-associated complex subunit alpha-like UBA domain-containing protein n=1 Tax=Pholiota conissans TaxID=109636 RepID=A0A9P6CSS0_9AGAR|nr:hypothetical protein BDN70DRAFT_879945 [Pholiota conissans]
MSVSNGRPEAEVIVNYADGFAFSKYKMEEAFRNGGFLERPAVKSPAALAHARDALGPAPKREDVDLIMHEFEISRAQAEKVLSENGGDVVKALTALVDPPSNVSS